MSGTVVVIGGANIDIVAAPYSDLKQHDSTPGHSSISFGGVGRNIAENLSRLGCNVRFVSVFGDDSFSKTLMKDMENKGIDISLSKVIRGASCSKYVCINSDKGELVAAVNDMSLYDHMDAAITDEAMEAMNKADLIVLDANTSQELLKKIASECTSLIAFDAVSISKVSRCSNILNRLFIFKPNLYEAEELCSRLGCEGAPDAKGYASILRSRGVKNVMISLGSEGVYYENEKDRGIVASMSKDIVNTSGCGDTFLAGVIKGYLDGGDIRYMAEYGSAAAAICAASKETVSDKLSPENVKKIMIAEKSK